MVYPAKFYLEGQAHICSILLINTNLSTDCYTILLLMHSNITAVCFRGDNSFLSLFNIYNEIIDNDTLTYLDSYLDHNTQLIRPSCQDSVVWLGDFNCHHPIWEEDTNERLYETEEFIAPLIEFLYKNKMLFTLPKGIPTFQSAAGSWTQPDNVWCCNTPDNPIARCDVVPAIRPPLVDHLPVITILDLLLPRVNEPHTLDFRQVNWIKVNEDLAQRLEAELPAVKIRSKEEFILKVNKLVCIIGEVLEDHLKERRPSPFKCQWWTKELLQLKSNKTDLAARPSRCNTSMITLSMVNTRWQ